MKFADDYDGFIKLLDNYYPRQTAMPLFDGLIEKPEESSVG
jgi:hypothetical protein